MRSIDPSDRSRVQRGVSDGGQFSTGARREPELSLSAPDPGGLGESVADLAAGAGGDGRLDAQVVQAASELVPAVDRRVLAEDYLAPMASAHRAGDTGTLQHLVERLDSLHARQESADPGFDPTPHVAMREGLRVSTGRHYTGDPVDLGQVATRVSADLQQAQQAGYLPDDVTFDVHDLGLPVGKVLSVQVRGMSDEDIYQPLHTSPTVNRRLLAGASDLRTRVNTIASAYGREVVHPVAGVFETSYYAHVQLEDEVSARNRQVAA